MRVSLKRCVVIIGVLTLTLLIWHVFFKQPNNLFTHTCNKTNLFQDKLHALTERVHDILRTLNLTHFLCYGTLWGQIRLSRTLPWEEKTVMCLLNEELSTKDELFVVRAFKKHGLDLAYDSTHGQYTVTSLAADPQDEHGPMYVLLVVFELDHLVGMYRRVGWKRRLLPPDCETMSSLNCFPPRLLQPPLPMKEFGRVLIPVPREGIEIQKYHYKDNWWKEVISRNC